MPDVSNENVTAFIFVPRHSPVLDDERHTLAPAYDYSGQENVDNKVLLEELLDKSTTL